MCGIAGIFSFQEQHQVTIHEMTEVLSHRGPDFGCVKTLHPFYFGHRRLSIIDLDARSHQPFFSSCKNFVIVFNGEIYNYAEIATELQLKEGIKFTTTSDTEVLIEGFAKWGMALIPKLRGMFAFVIADIRNNSIFICRDRAGKKPLFYLQDKEKFVFASEIKSILQYPGLKSHLIINKKAIKQFLHVGYIPEPYTIYEEIKKFPAGSYAVVKDSFEVNPIQYWNLPDFVSTKRKTPEVEAENKIENILHEAIKLRLVADVPVGSFLSGGIDSSIVTAIAAQYGKLKTFSIGFTHSKYNESHYAERVAKYLGTEHHSYLLKEEEAVSMIDVFLNHLDEPFADSSFIPTLLVSKLARQEVKVALTGDGGDELFLGYGAYTWANRLQYPFLVKAKPFYKNMLSSIDNPRFKRVANLFKDFKENQLRHFVFSQDQNFFTQFEIDALITKPSFKNFDITYCDSEFFYKLTEAEKQALFDFKNYLKDDLLVKVDRASMYHGLECRSPLLDNKLAEYVVNLPYALKVKNGETKYILKKVLYKYIPSSYFDRPKWGFSIPLEDWLSDKLFYLTDYLSEEKIEKVGLFDYSIVKQLLDNYLKGEKYLFNKIWLMIILQKFLLDNGK
jgi:asparagine synthase (glutamine-hydrolysing)